MNSYTFVFFYPFQNIFVSVLMNDINDARFKIKTVLMNFGESLYSNCMY